MDDVLKIRDEYRQIQRAAAIQKCTASGLSNKEYCIQHGLSEKSFYYWQKKLRTKIVDAVPELVPLEGHSEQCGDLRILYRGAELTLPEQVDMDAVAALLRSIQSL